MFTHLKKGDKVRDLRNNGTVSKVYEIRKRKYIDADGKETDTEIQLENGGWYSPRTGWYIGSADKKSGLQLMGRLLFKPLVESESDIQELTNLFEDEDLAKKFAEGLGFTYLGKGTTVEVPLAVKK